MLELTEMTKVYYLYTCLANVTVAVSLRILYFSRLLDCLLHWLSFIIILYLFVVRTLNCHIYIHIDSILHMCVQLLVVSEHRGKLYDTVCSETFFAKATKFCIRHYCKL